MAEKNLTAAFDSITYYKNKFGTETASVKTLQFEKHSLQDLILKKDRHLETLVKEFASVKSVTKFKSVIKLDTLYVPFKENMPCNFNRIDSVRSKFYSFNYFINSTEMQLEDFIIPNETTIITGFKRKWLLGSQTLTTDITNSNPYIKTESIVSAEIVLHETWYKKWYVWLIAGLVTGTLVK